MASWKKVVIESASGEISQDAAGLTATLAVSSGGSGATTLTDGGVLLGSGTGAVTAMSVLTDSQMIVGNGTTDPVAESGATLRTSIGVDASGTDNSTNVTLGGTPDYITISGQVITRAQIDLAADVTGDLPVSEGGTGVSTLTDGGVLLGSGTSAVTAMGVLANSEMIVGNGTTDPVAESGATLRTSIGVDASGTDNSTAVTLANTDYLSISGQEITGSTIPVANGGTNLTSYTAGDLVYASAGTTIAKLAKGTAGQVLKMNSGASAPEWSSDTDVDVTVSNLEARLPQIDTSVTIGDDTDITVTTAGSLTATRAITASNGELVLGKGQDGSLKVEAVAGTNIDGKVLTIAAGQGTGSGGGGRILFQVAAPGSSGTSANALATAMTIADSGSVTIAGDFTVNGTTTTIQTANLTVEDKNIVLGVPDSAFDNDAAAVAANTGGGISIVTDSATAGNYANLTWTSGSVLTGWQVEDTANAGSFDIAVMTQSTSAVTDEVAAGVGTFHFDTSNKALYIRQD